MAFETVPRSALPLLEFTPLSGVTPEQQADRLRLHGAHPPAEEFRQGLAALLFRPDVRMSDLVETADEAHRMALGVLALIECDEDTDARVTNAASAARAALEQAAGCLALMRLGMLHAEVRV